MYTGVCIVGLGLICLLPPSPLFIRLPLKLPHPLSFHILAHTHTRIPFLLLYIRKHTGGGATHPLHPIHSRHRYRLPMSFVSFPPSTSSPCPPSSKSPKICTYKKQGGGRGRLFALLSRLTLLLSLQYSSAHCASHSSLLC